MRFRRFSTLLLLATTATLVSACSSKRKARRDGLAPLTASSWLVPLPVNEFGEQRLALPLGATRPRPLLVALPGEVDRPEWQCGSYRGISHGRSFILCPARSADPEACARQLRAAIAALKQRYGAHLARGSVVLSALGPGVDQALAIALQEPSFFSELVLVNGSLARLTPAFATRFGAAGGKRVLVVCSRAGCDADADVRVQSLRPAGVEARFIAQAQGQGLDADVASVIEKQWAWLVGSDSRWR